MKNACARFLGTVSVLAIFVIATGFWFDSSRVLITHTQGNGTVIKAGDLPAYTKKGDFLKGGDTVVTRHKGVVDLVLNGNVGVRLLEHTECLIVQTSPSRMKLELIRGNAIFNVKALKGRAHFEVETPTAIASVRGTQFWGRVGSSEQDKVTATFAVREGTIQLIAKSTGTAYEITSGNALEIPDQGGDALTPRLATDDEMKAMTQASEIAFSAPNRA